MLRIGWFGLFLLGFSPGKSEIVCGLRCLTHSLKDTPLLVLCAAPNSRFWQELKVLVGHLTTGNP